MDSDKAARGGGGVTRAAGFNAAMGETLIGSFSLLVCRGYVHSQCCSNY